jgi:hypothetical protein
MHERLIDIARYGVCFDEMDAGIPRHSPMETEFVSSECSTLNSEDDLSAARGIIIALLISSPMLILVWGAALWALLS